MPLKKPIRTVAVVGTGSIGASWASLFLAKGFDVVATDPAPSAESRLRQYIDTAWAALRVLGISPEASPDHLAFATSIEEAVAEADFVQESGPEDLALKAEMFEVMDRASPAGAILASSTAGLFMTDIQAPCEHPERCVVGHPINPPHLMPLVEIVPGRRTSDATVRAAMAFYSSIGKKPILVRKEIPGHVANRLQAALYAEVFHLIDRGVIDVADADAVVSWGPGLRWGVMGPNLLLHLGGGSGGIHHFMEHLAGPMTHWWQDLGRPTLTPELRQTVIDGVLREVGPRSVEQLGRECDELLMGLLRLRSKFAGLPPADTKAAGRARRKSR
jgi:3-hydroxyacyl-CoA dehydrogenase